LMVLPHLPLFRTKVVRKIKINFRFSNFFFENRAVYETIGKKFRKKGRPQMRVWRMNIACWINKATNTHTEYVILFVFILLGDSPGSEFHTPKFRNSVFHPYNREFRKIGT